MNKALELFTGRLGFSAQEKKVSHPLAHIVPIMMAFKGRKRVFSTRHRDQKGPLNSRDQSQIKIGRCPKLSGHLGRHIGLF